MDLHSNHLKPVLDRLDALSALHDRGDVETLEKEVKKITASNSEGKAGMYVFLQMFLKSYRISQ